MANKPLWLTDIKAWNNLNISDKLTHLHKYLCTGPCGQSCSVMQTRSVISEALKQAIRIIKSEE